MDQNQKHNLAVIRHWFDTINENDTAKMLKEFAEIITGDYLLHDPSTPDLQPGAANFLKLFEQQLAEGADRKLTIEDMFAADDKVVSRVLYEFLALATQERKKMAGITISRFEDGKIIEEWQVVTPLETPSK